MLRGLIVTVMFWIFGILPGAAGGMENAAIAPPSDELEAPAGPAVAAPLGWLDFCKRYSGECDDRYLPPAKLDMTAAIWSDLRGTNDLVNRTIEPESDRDHWGADERWDFPTDGKGDCEDYVLMKRKILMTHGYPRQALLIAVVYRPDDKEGHAVLMVKTDAGDLVLDNRRDMILQWNDTGYEFLKRQSQENQNRWVRLGNPVSTPPAVSAQSP